MYRPHQEGLSSRDIGQLLAVADHGSIRRAADVLGMTQPGLSKNIRLIEERLGLSVFDRATSGAVPTDAGRLLLERGRQILLDLQAMQRDLKAGLLAEAGEVRIGCGPVPAQVIAGEMIPAALASHPQIAVDLDVASPAVLIDRLVRGTLDFLIATSDGYAIPDGIVARKVVEVTPIAFVRRGHSLAGIADLTFPQLAGWKLAGVHPNPPFDAWIFTQFGNRKPDYGFMCDDFDLLGRTVERSDMVCFTTAYIYRRLERGLDILRLPLPPFGFRHRIDCLQPASRQLSAPAKTMLRLCEAALVESVRTG